MFVREIDNGKGNQMEKLDENFEIKFYLSTSTVEEIIVEWTVAEESQ